MRKTAEMVVMEFAVLLAVGIVVARKMNRQIDFEAVIVGLHLMVADLSNLNICRQSNNHWSHASCWIASDSVVQAVEQLSCIICIMLCYVLH
jgi:hypothetical protein